MKKILFYFISFFIFFLFFPKTTFADENFDVSSVVTYTVNSSGVTHVHFSVTLENTTAKYYATSYTLHLGFQNITNSTAHDNGGTITPEIKKTNTGEDITIPFNQKAIGLHAKLPFEFAFDTPDVSSLNGSIWEVNIPGLSNSADFSNFTVQVVVPSYFGKPTYIKPYIDNNSLTFTKDQLGESGISLAFGDKQVYAFNLTYHLKNSQLFPVRTEVALPPNTTYQDIEIDDITPRPLNVIKDADGNWLAQYTLNSSQVITVKARGKAYLSLTPTQQPLSQNQQSLYTKQNAYWQTDSNTIQKLAHQLKTPEAIYKYVVTHLTYDFSRVSDTQNRLGAVGVLEHPTQAVCLEFTDLFIALARAAGIPARELDGYAYTQNTIERPLSLQKEVLHAWPEYYDNTKGTWVMVDPTWENTTGGVDYFHTFDFDHLTLVIKGLSSTYPVPAGGYKFPGQEAEKDVNVTFAPIGVPEDPVVAVSSTIPPEITAGFPLTGSLLLQNTGHVLFPGQSLTISSTLGAKQTVTTQDIPPFGSTNISVDLGKTKFLTNAQDMITISLAGKTITKSVHITAFSLLFYGILGGIIIVISSIIIPLIARRPRSIPIS